jgi:DNA-binding winged helix-turn-helix (wHTH) protein/tetratricopeptide (TPR) repeat protein
MIYLFGEYELDSDVFEIRCAGNLCKLEPKAFDVLLYLIQNHERIVSKEELLSQLWDDQYISDAALNSCIMSARKAVGDSGTMQQVIQTHRSRGYRFIAAFTVREGAVREGTVREGNAFTLAPEPLPTLPDATPVDAAATTEMPQYQGMIESRESDPRAPLCPACRHCNRLGAIFCGACGGRLIRSCTACGQAVLPSARFCQRCGHCLEGEELSDTRRGGWTRRPWVGRAWELGCVETLMRRVADGQGQVVELVGHAGMGKSRLIGEISRQASEHAFITVQGICAPRRQALAGMLLRDIIRQCCGVTLGDRAEVVLARVYQRLRQVGMDAAAAAPYLLDVLACQERTGILAAQTPDTICVNTLLTLQRLLHACSEQQPLLMVIEDIQWMDPTSEDCLAVLAENLATVPVLLVVTRRPGLRPAWLQEAGATLIHLQPLDVDDSRRLVQMILGPYPLPPPQEQAIISWAGGNPLWVEELTRWVAERGPEPAAVLLPDAMADVVLARLEQLSPLAKQVLQTASVIGREFTFRMLRQVWNGEEQLDAALLELESRALCYAKHDAWESVYGFAHSVLQELAYTSLAPLHRLRLHAAVGEALETFYADCLEQVAGVLAWHYAQSERTQKALEYLTRVVQHALQRGAYQESLMVGEEALNRVERLPVEERVPIRLSLVLEQARALNGLGRLEETVAVLQPLSDDASALADRSLIGPYALVLSQAYSQMELWDKAAEQAQRAVQAAQSCRDDLTLAQAFHILAMHRHRAGKFREGAEYSRQSRALLERPEARGQLANTCFVLGLNTLMLGDFTTALEAEAQAEAISRRLGDLSLQVSAAWATGWIQAARGCYDEGIAACQRGLACAPDPLSAAFVLGWMGYAYLEKGDAEEAVSCLEQAVRHMQQCGYPRMQGLYTTFLGAAHLLQGDIDKARELIHQGVELARAAQDRFGIGWGLRMLGHVDETCGHYNEAQQYFHVALQAFATLQASFEVARTQLALAEVAYQQGGHDMATEHLREAYQQFTSLDVAAYVQRTEQRAAELGLPLPCSASA